MLLAGWLDGWLAGWLLLQTLKAGRIIFFCRVLADLIYGGTRFRVFFPPPPSLSLQFAHGCQSS
jgi:hypothetical protein